MELPKLVNGRAVFPAEADTEEYARLLDSEDPLRSFRDKFIIPTKISMKTRELRKPDLSQEQCVYFCGNSLGLQPKAVSKYLEAQLNTWASIGVDGHFTEMGNSPLTQWQSMAELASKDQARLFGALPDEIATMGSLTTNLHLLMASFYKPTPKKHKIILEWKAFPSDHYMFESQIRWHKLNPADSMVLLSPDLDNGNYNISTAQVLQAIDANATDTALILLPGVQYYSGQLFDISTITKYAQSKGIVVGWDLAHAAGNVPLSLHEWNVDFAAWCTYKYMNAGPGAIAGLFVHERHGKVDYSSGEDKPQFLHRLTGWYGGDKASRFNMDNKFRPCPGASGWQVSNPSAIDISSLLASLSVFNETSMDQIRQKSLLITAYLEYLLLDGTQPHTVPYSIITPSNPEERGAQLSILLKAGLLPPVFQKLSDDGFVFDQRKPDVIRIAPAPLYNTFTEVWLFVKKFKAALAAVPKN